jgi:hypothetical protein
MIEILPPNLAAHVEKKCGSLAGEEIINFNLVTLSIYFMDGKF